MYIPKNETKFFRKKKEMLFHRGADLKILNWHLKYFLTNKFKMVFSLYELVISLVIVF